MPGLNIVDLAQGMNLRDPALDITPGEVGETLGCDFSVPGVVTPMRAPLLVWTLPEDIQDATLLYLGTEQYLFTTHTDGLRVTFGTTTLLLNASFTGLFKALAINGQYVVLANATMNIKWLPNWGARTYQWGLNTPPDVPVLSSGGSGGLTGTFRVAVAYQNEFANYGAYTAYSDSITLSSEALTISNLTPDTDTQTVKRRIALIGGSFTVPMVMYLEKNIDDTITFDTADLAEAVDQELYFNNHPPPVGILDMVSVFGQVFLVIGDHNLYYSLPLFYEGFPYTYYRSMFSDEKLRQVAVQGQNIASRGIGGEYLTQLNTSDPSLWVDVQGAPEGAVSSRFLIKDITGAHVYASPVGLYASGIGFYLPKINSVIVNPQQTKGDPSLIFGDHIADRAYLYFEDIDGVDRVMRIDYRLGRPVAHYVANIKPTAIFSDTFLQKVYYALGAEILEFDADTGPMDTKLTIPESLMDYAGDKDFGPMSYELETSPLTFQVVVDRQIKAGTYTLPVAVRERSPVTLPPYTGQQLGLIITSTGVDFTIRLPWQIQAVPASG